MICSVAGLDGELVGALGSALDDGAWSTMRAASGVWSVSDTSVVVDLGMAVADNDMEPLAFLGL